MTKQKHCTDCTELKELTQFSGRQTKCRACMVARMSKWRHKNRERYNKYQREYHRNHA